MLLILSMLLLILVMSPSVTAQQYVGSDWALFWNAPVGGGPVDGYKVYFEQTDPVSLITMTAGKNERSFALRDADLAEGSWTAWVTSYNLAGESDPSNTVPFVYLTITLIAPGSPDGARLGVLPGSN